MRRGRGVDAREGFAGRMADEAKSRAAKAVVGEMEGSTWLGTRLVGTLDPVWF